MKIIKILLAFSLLIFLTGCGENSENTGGENLNNSAGISPTPVRTSVNTTANALNTVNDTKSEEELSTFTTTIHTKTSERQHNLELTSNKINGHIVHSGEEFSFCNLVGQSTPEKGYVKAEIFDSKGNKKQGYGGGNCQVSSTLYNAVAAVSGLEVLERHNHSNKVPYIETGKDAAVFYGSYDFRFKNNTGFDVKIVTSPTKDDLTIKILKVL